MGYVRIENRLEEVFQNFTNVWWWNIIVGNVNSFRMNWVLIETPSAESKIKTIPESNRFSFKRYRLVTIQIQNTNSYFNKLRVSSCKPWNPMWYSIYRSYEKFVFWTLVSTKISIKIFLRTGSNLLLQITFNVILEIENYFKLLISFVMNTHAGAPGDYRLIYE